MTVASATRHVKHLADGIVTEFAFTFKIPTEGDLVVMTYNPDTMVKVIVDPADYTVDGIGEDAGGSVTFDTAPAADLWVVILREMDYFNSLDIPSFGAFDQASVELQLDRLAMQTGQLGETLGRTVQLIEGEAAFTKRLPHKTELAGKLIVFNSQGEPEASPTLSSEVSFVGMPELASRSLLGAVAPQVGSVFLSEAGREGMFRWSSSDLSTFVTADPQQGLVIPPVTDLTGASGAWRRIATRVTPEMFGAPANDSGDDAPAMTAMATALQVIGGATAQLTPGKIYRLSTQMTWDCDYDLFGNDGSIRQNYSGGAQIVIAGSATQRVRVRWLDVDFKPTAITQPMFETRWVRIFDLVRCTCTSLYQLAKLGRVADTTAKPTTFFTLDNCYFTQRAVASGDHVDLLDAINVVGGVFQISGEMEAAVDSANAPAFLRVVDNIQTRMDHVAFSAGALVKQYSYVVRAENKRVVNLETGMDCRFDNTRVAAFRMFADGVGDSSKGWGAIKLVGSYGGLKGGKIVDFEAALTSGASEFSELKIGPLFASSASGATFDHLIHIKANATSIINSVNIHNLMLTGFQASGAGKNVVWLDGGAAATIVDFAIDHIQHRAVGGTAFVDIVKVETTSLNGIVGDNILSNNYSGKLINWPAREPSARLYHTGGLTPRNNGEGTDTTPVITETHIVEIEVRRLVRATGIALFNGSAVLGNVKLGLTNALGTVIAETASTAQSGTDAYQRVPFTAVKDLYPGTYYMLAQFGNTGARFNTHPFGNFGASKKTGEVFGTLTTITPPTTFTADVGPMASLY